MLYKHQLTLAYPISIADNKYKPLFIDHNFSLLRIKVSENSGITTLVAATG